MVSWVSEREEDFLEGTWGKEPEERERSAGLMLKPFFPRLRREEGAEVLSESLGERKGELALKDCLPRESLEE